MASQARKAFDESSKDILRLLEIHSNLGGEKKGRRYKLEVLNKSAIVLITAIWEAYCEDIVAEAVEHIVSHSSKATVLSKEIKKIVAKELEADKNDLAVWDLADDGWRAVLRSRLARLQDERNRRLNTPRSAQITELFQKAVGIDDITAAWSWKNMTVSSAQQKLDDYVTLRGEIAHRGKTISSCSKKQVKDFLGHVKRLVGKTGGRLNGYVKKITRMSMW